MFMAFFTVFIRFFVDLFDFDSFFLFKGLIDYFKGFFIVKCDSENDSSYTYGAKSSNKSSYHRSSSRVRSDLKYYKDIQSDNPYNKHSSDSSHHKSSRHGSTSSRNTSQKVSSNTQYLPDKGRSSLKHAKKSLSNIRLLYNEAEKDLMKKISLNKTERPEFNSPSTNSSRLYEESAMLDSHKSYENSDILESNKSPKKNA
jgi:hypothetical protein